MKRLTICLLAVLGTALAARAQGSLPLTPDAKVLGMGGVAMTTLSGSHAIYGNSAMAAFSMMPLQVSSSYLRHKEADYYAVTGYGRFDRFNLVQLGWRQYLRERGNNDLAVDLGYSRRIGDSWAVGLVGRYARLKRPADIRENALAVDLSAAWMKPLELGSYSMLRAGARVANLGGYFGDTEERLPMSLTAGAALDTFGMQLNEQYAKLAGTYERIVEQRNSLLKERWCTREVLGAWNDSLVQAGASLLVHRISLLDRLRAHLVDVYEAIAPGEHLEVAYRSTVGEMACSCDGHPLTRDEMLEQARGLFAAALDEHADEELARGVTLTGPHRDEIAFTIDGRDARSFASQGQQRSLVLAWKVAEVEVTRDILGRPPLLLLDDVMSELDADRRASFLRFIQDGIQTVITTTNLGYFSDDVLRCAKVVKIGDAQ